ncbi:hypothetical protein NT6N_33180 [Oceaniferula spumae]|uniref:Uncharacterized protein n=1 Tax=Oceaniferula spumae TaxID=2979115 RepID=A0AAT9FQR0_9BACT
MNWKYVLYIVIIFKLMTGFSYCQSQKENVSGVTGYVLGDSFKEEYPFLERYEDLLSYKIIHWSGFINLSDSVVKEGQIDGFLKVQKPDAKSEAGNPIYRLYLYKSVEDMKYKRLGSCIVLSYSSKELMKNNLSITDPNSADGKYCVVTGFFQKENGTASRLGKAIRVTGLYFRKEKK